MIPMLSVLLQADSSLAAEVARIATAQVVMAAAMVLILLMALLAAIAAWRASRAAARLMADLQKIAERLSIRAEPLIDSGRRVVDDASDVTRRVRKQADTFADTLAELNESLRHGTAEARRRVQEFGAVLDIVGEEAEDLLIDTTARARGLRITADALRGRRRGRRVASPPASPSAEIPPATGAAPADHAGEPDA